MDQPTGNLIGGHCGSVFDCPARTTCYFYEDEGGTCLCIKRAAFSGKDCSQVPFWAVLCQFLLCCVLHYYASRTLKVFYRQFKAWKYSLKTETEAGGRSLAPPPLFLILLGWNTTSQVVFVTNMCIFLCRMAMARMEGTLPLAIEAFMARKLCTTLLNFGFLCALLTMLVTGGWWYEKYLLATLQHQRLKRYLKNRKFILVLPVAYIVACILVYFLLEIGDLFLHLGLMVCTLLTIIVYAWGGIHLRLVFHRMTAITNIPSDHYRAVEKLRHATNDALVQVSCILVLAVAFLMTEFFPIPDALHFWIGTGFYLCVASLMNTLLKYAAPFEDVSLMSWKQSLVMFVDKMRLRCCTQKKVSPFALMIEEERKGPIPTIEEEKEDAAAPQEEETW